MRKTYVVNVITATSGTLEKGATWTAEEVEKYLYDGACETQDGQDYYDGESLEEARKEFDDFKVQSYLKKGLCGYYAEFDCVRLYCLTWNDKDDVEDAEYIAEKFAELKAEDWE